MTLNKKHCLIFLAIIVILIIGMSIASATNVNDANHTQEINDNQKLSTPTKYDVDKMVQSEAKTISSDANEQKTDTTNQENKTITKKTDTTTKQETYSDVRINLTSEGPEQYRQVWGTYEEDVYLYHENGGDNSDITGELNVEINQEYNFYFPVNGGVAHVSIPYDEIIERSYTSENRFAFTYYYPDHSNPTYNSPTKVLSVYKLKFSPNADGDDPDLNPCEFTVSSNTPVELGQNIVITGRLLGTFYNDDDSAYTKPLTGIKFNLLNPKTINNNVIATNRTDENGYYHLTIPATEVGTKTYRVRLVAEGAITESKTSNAKVTVKGQSTNITLDATDIIIGQNTTISGKVYAVNTGESLQTGTVNITVKYDGNNVFTKKNLNINESGEFSVTYNATNLGQHTVSVVFNPTGEYDKGTNTTKFTVSPHITNMTIINDKTVFIGENVSINGTLSDQLGIIPNARLTVRIGQHYIDEVEVDENGNYNLTYNTNSIGEHQINVTYISDNLMLPVQ